MKMSARGYVLRAIDSDDERLNIRFHDENVAITGMGAYRQSENRIVLTLVTPRGSVDLEITPAFANQIATALHNPQ